MLGLALTPPPPESELAQSLRVARVVAFVIGLAAGNAGLAGSLADRADDPVHPRQRGRVGAVAALYGRTQRARILGWLFASIMAQAFVLTVGLVAGLPRTTSAFGVLAVGAALLVVRRAAAPPAPAGGAARGDHGRVERLRGGADRVRAGLRLPAAPRRPAGRLGRGARRRGDPPRPPAAHRRVLFYAALACEVVAWWLLMRLADVALPRRTRCRSPRSPWSPA